MKQLGCDCWLVIPRAAPSPPTQTCPLPDACFRVELFLACVWGGVSKVHNIPQRAVACACSRRATTHMRPSLRLLALLVAALGKLSCWHVFDRATTTHPCLPHPLACPLPASRRCQQRRGTPAAAWHQGQCKTPGFQGAVWKRRRTALFALDTPWHRALHAAGNRAQACTRGSGATGKSPARLLGQLARYDLYKAAGGYSPPSDGTSDGPGCPLLWLQGHINGSRVHMHVWIRSMFLEPTRPGATQRVQVRKISGCSGIFTAQQAQPGLKAHVAALEGVDRLKHGKHGRAATVVLQLSDTVLVSVRPCTPSEDLGGHLQPIGSFVMKLVSYICCSCSRVCAVPAVPPVPHV